jgi:hypothetical protein
MTDLDIEEALLMSEPPDSAPPPDSAHYREIANWPAVVASPAREGNC